MNPIGRQQVARLYELAQEKSDQARRVLVENISDLFLSPDGRLNEHQRMLMTEILYKLVSEMEIIVRKELAEELAGQPDIPRELMKLLANDKIEIARPVLEHSRLLTDADLIEIARMRTDEHRLAIAMRDRVSEPVSDALVEEGSVDVIEALLKNEDAGISARAMEYLVAESEHVDRFQEPLLSRNDLPPALAHRMFWWVSAALRRQILLTHTDVDVAGMDRALQSATRTAIGGHVAGGGLYGQAQKLVAHLDEQGQLTLSFLTRSLKQQKVPVFVAGLARLADITVRTAWQIFSDKGGESFAVLCRALDVPRQDFASLFLFVAEARGGERVRPTAFLKEILDLFDSISVSNARAALTYWQRNEDFQDAIDGLKDAD